MNLREAIIPYTDGNGLIAPSLFPAGTQRACDNGILFLSVLHLLLNNRGEGFESDPASFRMRISQSIGADLELHRAPGDDSPDEIDDYLGALAVLNRYGLKAEFKLPLRLCRFPQLVYVYLLNKGFPRALMLPLEALTALIIAISCWNTEVGNSNDRQLNWTLVQALKGRSLICTRAGKLNAERQNKLYKSGDYMKLIMILYYQERHPFIQYWRNSK